MSAAKKNAKPQRREVQMSALEKERPLYELIEGKSALEISAMAATALIALTRAVSELHPDNLDLEKKCDQALLLMGISNGRFLRESRDRILAAPGKVKPQPRTDGR